MNKEIQKAFDDLGVDSKIQKEVWNRVLKNSEFHQIILKEAEIVEEGQKLKDMCGESWHKYLKDIFKLDAEYEEINNELNAIYEATKDSDELYSNKEVKKLEKRLKEWNEKYDKYIGFDIRTGEMVDIGEIFKEELQQTLSKSDHMNKEMYKAHIVSGLTQQKVADKYNYSSVRGAQKAIKSVKEETVIPALFHLPYK